MARFEEDGKRMYCGRRRGGYEDDFVTYCCYALTLIRELQEILKDKSVRIDNDGSVVSLSERVYICVIYAIVMMGSDVALLYPRLIIRNKARFDVSSIEPCLRST